MRDTLNGVSRNSIRLRRVILLRSDIRLTPNDICFASFRRIEYHCAAKPNNITSRKGNITLCVSKEYHFQFQHKRESILGFPICSLFLFVIRGLSPYAFD